jgi:selenocysteine lyase/cysteine desulfurase/tRNA(Ile)-lysidine synthase TilS/MesJ
MSIEQLECGSSLAEWEHGVHAGATDNVVSSSSAHDQDLTSVKSVATLRESLANDVLTSNGAPVEFFTSPFEIPSTGAAQLNQSSASCRGSTSTSKYLQVPLVYCDQTASNRPLQSLEDYMRHTCLPLYGNTHTNTSVTGAQSTAFCAEARQVVAEATNAKITGKASLDVVLFCGNGTTSAVHLLLDCMGLSNLRNDDTKKPVVFVGPYEHHSNLLPWRESGCEIVMVPECIKTKAVDLAALERLLQNPEYKDRLKMGTFTAASNVTGHVSDVDAIATVLHTYGALAFFDYATGAPYLPMNMNPSSAAAAKDAIFLSPHKMAGGVGTPGVLIVKKHLVQQSNVPSMTGGGTVFYVTSQHHRFLSNRVERNEGGTPNVAGIWRTGLTFLWKRQAELKYRNVIAQGQQQKDMVPQSMLDFEYYTYSSVAKELKARAPNLILLSEVAASDGGHHLPIFSLLIRCGRRFLHYNYVCAVLNDVFGIQSRGGCQCAGPYSQRLLGLTTLDTDIPNDRNAQVEHALVHYKERAELLRPGFSRLSLPFKGLRNAEVQYVVDALVWVSHNAWMLMPQYRCNHRTGDWRHSHRQGKPLGRTERKWLSHFDSTKTASEKTLPTLDIKSVEAILEQARANADAILADAKKDQRSIAQALKMNEASASTDNDDDALLEELRWFVYPKECATWLTTANGNSLPPNTDSQDILGALRPLAMHMDTEDTSKLEAPMVVAEQPQEVKTTAIIDAPSRKRKNTVRKPLEEERTISPTAKNTFDDGAIVQFREGENHAGEAPIADLEAGFDDGELSGLCEVYDASCDTWVRIEVFLHARKKSRSNEEEDRKPSAVLAAEASPPAVSPNSFDATVKDEKNQKKKAPRDSSQWGQSKYVPVKIKALVVSTPAMASEGAMVPITSVPDVPASFKKKRGRGVKPPSKMMRNITQAMIQWNMIEEGDRLLLGLSGGKDSLCLLHCLLEFQRKMPVNFEIEVCTIDPMTPSFDPSPLIPYVESLGLKYYYIKDDIVDRANKSGSGGSVVSSLCAFCARMKRGNLYTCARRNKCNKLVLAQHLDDCAESFFMSVMHNGFLRTMKAHYQINAGDISVIRPMVYCRESLMTEFAKAANLPVINENCPACFEEPKERARIKKLLSREETLFPNFYDNIRRSLIPLFHEDATAILRCYTDEALSKSRKENHKKTPKGGKRAQKQIQQAGSEEKKDDAPAVNKARMDREEHEAKRMKLTLSEATEDDLIKEIARRRAEKFKLSGSMKRLKEGEDGMPEDPTGQVCSLNGGDGSIPCTELME